MSSVANVCSDSLPSSSRWIWPLDLSRYDRTPLLTLSEQEALRRLYLAQT